jgi:hypothetical protein
MLELSLQGKWIALARKWLEQNGPCTLQEYMLGVIPLMPTHILIDGKRRGTAVSLAKQALRRIATQSDSGQVVAKKRVTYSMYDYSNLHSLLNADGCLEVKSVEMPHKQKRALQVWLGRHWQRVSKGVYKPKSEAGQ